MSDTASAADTGLPPVLLHGNSYNLQDLLKASAHAEELKTEDGRAANLAKLADKCALNQDVLNGLNAPPVPEGHELAEIEDAQGRRVQVPVAVAAEQPAEEKPADTAATDGTTEATGRRKRQPSA